MLKERLNLKAILIIFSVLVVALIGLTVYQSIVNKKKYDKISIESEEYVVDEWGLDYSTNILFQDGDWAIVGVGSSSCGNIQGGIMVVKLNGDKFNVVAGPSTGITTDSLPNGVPRSIGNYLKNFYSGKISPQPHEYQSSYEGFDELCSKHSNTWVGAVKTAIVLYARKENTKLTRVSLIEDSYAFDEKSTSTLYETATTFKIVLNVDQTRLNISIMFSSLYGTSIKIYNDSNKEVFSTNNVSYSVRSMTFGDDNPPANTSVTRVKTTLTKESASNLVLNDNMPSLQEGDNVELYYACPKTNLNPENICRVYKYDFYY